MGEAFQNKVGRIKVYENIRLRHKLSTTSAVPEVDCTKGTVRQCID